MSGLTLNLQSSYHFLQNAGVAGVYCLRGPAVWVNRDTEHGSLKSTDPQRPFPPGMPGSCHRCVESAPTHQSRRPGDISRVLLCAVFWALQSTEQPRPRQNLHRPQMHVKGLGQAARKGRSELAPFTNRRGGSIHTLDRLPRTEKLQDRASVPFRLWLVCKKSGNDCEWPPLLRKQRPKNANLSSAAWRPAASFSCSLSPGSSQAPAGFTLRPGQGPLLF